MRGLYTSANKMAGYDLLTVTVNNDGSERSLMSVLDGKIAIVTGTSRGVGVGIAHELLRAGATVIGCSRSPLDALPALKRVGAPRFSAGLRSG